MKKYLILFLTIILLCSCGKKEDEIPQDIIATWDASNIITFEDGSNVEFDTYKNKRFYRNNDKYEASYGEEKAAIIGDVTVSEYIMEKGQFRPREENEFKSTKVNGKTIKYYLGEGGVDVTCIMKCNKEGLYTRYKTCVIHIKQGISVDDAIKDAIPYMIDTNHLTFDKLKIGSDITVINSAAVSMITKDAVSSGETWGISKQGILKKSAGYKIENVGQYVIKYKSTFNIASVIQVGG